ncbi:MAG TPA: substrate-binding domain-containing protein, partial [Herpetosiphonaceae bacterium]|nr:substrate-binding domain-containing protein [Herpetosiphonaceae bacterium]
IVHISGPLSNKNARERLDGYTSALADAGIAVDPALVLAGNFLEDSGLRTMDRFLAGGGRCTAVFAANDQMAIGARLALFNHGLAVPGDVSLVGFDDQPISRYAIPPLTTVSQPTAELGRSAARAMLSMLAGQETALPEFAARLVLRQSTAPPAES